VVDRRQSISTQVQTDETRPAAERLGGEAGDAVATEVCGGDGVNAGARESGAGVQEFQTVAADVE